MSKSKDLTEALFIKNLIRRVHKELVESQEQREEDGMSPLFTVSDLTIEVNFVVSEHKKGGGELDFKIITAGAKAEYSNEQVHKVTLCLKSLLTSEQPEEEKRYQPPLQTFLNIPRDKTIGDQVFPVYPVCLVPGMHPTVDDSEDNVRKDDPLGGGLPGT